MLSMAPDLLQEGLSYVCHAGASGYVGVECLEPLYVMARMHDRVFAAMENIIEMSQESNIDLPNYCMLQQFHF